MRTDEKLADAATDAAQQKTLACSSQRSVFEVTTSLAITTDRDGVAHVFARSVLTRVLDLLICTSCEQSFSAACVRGRILMIQRQPNANGPIFRDYFLKSGCPRLVRVSVLENVMRFTKDAGVVGRFQFELVFLSVGVVTCSS